MFKVAASAVVAFMLGGGVMGLLSSVLPAYAEAASLGLVGVSLFAASQAFGAKLPETAPTPSPVSQS